MKIKAFIFDLDGTLIDTELLWAEAIVQYLAHHQIKTTLDKLMPLVYGHAWSDIYTALISEFPVIAGIPVDQMAVELRAFFLQLRDNTAGLLIPTSITLLKNLAQEYPVIIVSGSPRIDIEEAVSIMGIKQEVRFVLGSEDYAPGKPSPAGFLLGAKKLGVKPEECLVFEDSQAGVMAAKRAGMYCVALVRPESNPLPQNFDAADWVLSDLADFSLKNLSPGYTFP